MKSREAQLRESAEQLGLKAHIDSLTLADIDAQLKKLGDMALYVEAADRLRSYIRERSSVARKENASPITRLYYEVHVGSKADHDSILKQYELYQADLKKSPEYQALSSEEKTEHDNLFSLKQQMHEGRKVFVLTFASLADADEFLKAVKRQGIHLRMVKKIDLLDHPDDASELNHRPRR